MRTLTPQETQATAGGHYLSCFSLLSLLCFKKISYSSCAPKPTTCTPPPPCGGSTDTGSGTGGGTTTPDPLPIE